MDNLEPSHIDIGNVKWPLGKKIWQFLNKLHIELPCDPAIPLLGLKTQKN